MMHLPWGSWVSAEMLQHSSGKTASTFIDVNLENVPLDYIASLFLDQSLTMVQVSSHSFMSISVKASAPFACQKKVLDLFYPWCGCGTAARRALLECRLCTMQQGMHNSSASQPSWMAPKV
jgi:hypothetical protein